MERGQDSTTRKLGILDYLDRETVRVYDATIRKVQDGETRVNLQRFRDDHARLAGELDQVADRMGWRRESPSQAFRHFFEEHLRVIENAKNQDEALEGLLLIEQANLGECRRTLAAGPPLGAADIVKQMCSLEVRDVEYLATHVMPMTGLSAVTHDATSGAGAWDMSEQELVVMLSGLRYMDQQTAAAYDAAMPQAQDDGVAGQLQQFRDDHIRHVQAIENLLEKMGKMWQLPTQELQQYLAEAVGIIGRATSQDDAMERVLLLERANAAEYESVARANLPTEDAMHLIDKHHLEEQHHATWVEARTPLAVGYGSQGVPRIGEDPTGTSGL